MFDMSKLTSAFKDHYKKAEEVRVLLPVGAGLDLLTGKFLFDNEGRAHLNGGFNKLMGVGGRGNTFKSTLARFFTVTGMGRYLNVGGLIYDTEDSVQLERVLIALSKYPKFMDTEQLIEQGMLQIADTNTLGNEFFASLRETSKAKVKNFEKNKLTTPFVLKNGDSVKMMPPSFGEVDSVSQMPVQVVESIYDKNEIGESGMNVEAMRSAAAKSQMVKQLPGITTSSDTYMTLVAHMGDEIVMDQYAPSTKKLGYMKNKIKFKGVPEAYTFLMNTLFCCMSALPLVNRSDKGPEYPRIAKERNPSNDLMIIEVQLLRCKTAPSGNITYIVTSQEEGVLPTLTELHLLRVIHKYYGLGGNNTTFFCELMPDVSMTRTNARETIDSNVLLQRAINITLEIKQMYEYHSATYADVLTSPKALYEGLKEKGYNWDHLLNTRGYWVFKEQEEMEPLREFTSLDMLNLLAGKLKLTSAEEKHYKSQTTKEHGTMVVKINP